MANLSTSDKFLMSNFNNCLIYSIPSSWELKFILITLKTVSFISPLKKLKLNVFKSIANSIIFLSNSLIFADKLFNSLSVGDICIKSYLIK